MIWEKIYKTEKLRVRQHYKYDCGAASLASVAAFYGIKESLAQIRILCGCTPEGISMQGIIDGATALGLNAKGYKSYNKEIHLLKKIEAPSIVHTIDEDGCCHFITLYEIGKDKVRIMNPSSGRFEQIPIPLFIEKWSGYIILITPDNSFENNINDNIKTASLLKSILKGNFRDIILAFTGAIICTATGISTTFILQQLIDNLLPTSNIPLIAISGIILFLLMLSSLYIGYTCAKYLIQCSIKIETSITAQYIEKLFKLPAGFFNNYTAGDLSSRIDDIRNIRSIVTEGIIGSITGAITIIGALCVMFLYNTRLSFCVMGIIPVYWCIYKISGHLSKKYSKDIASANGAFESTLLEGIAANSCLRHFNVSQMATWGIGKKLVALTGKTQLLANAVNLLESFTFGISRLLICIILTVGSAAILKNEMSIGAMVGFYSLCTFITTPLNSLIDTAAIISKAAVSYRRISEIILLPDESTAPDTGISPIGINGDIVISGIGFRYPGREDLFKNLSLTVTQGKITLFKGESGKGKSTLAQLILRDFMPNCGNISYGGINIAQFNISKWRDIIGYVPQKCFIFNTSILYNITLEKNDPDIERVIKICSMLNMTSMIEKFPQGLLTIAGEGGKGLSGGECQKICIARALYKDPPIFIFDEVTSSLDKESENCINECIKKLKDKGKTIILISHKSENFCMADNIVNIC